MRTLYRVTEGTATWGLVAQDGVVVACAPYGRRRYLGRRLSELVARGMALQNLGPDPAVDEAARQAAFAALRRNRGEPG